MGAIYLDLSITELITKTLPFFLMRILVYGLFGVISLIFLGIVVGIGYLLIRLVGDVGVALIFVIVIAFLILYGALKFVERYVLYMVKLGHVSVIVELLRTGNIPEGKGLVAYGKDQVKESFGSSNVAFVLDKMVYAAVKQIQRWVMRIGELFSFLPGSNTVISIVNSIMSVSLNYIDEAIMSYIFLRKTEIRDVNVWKEASDGVILYAQSWKGIIKSAAISVMFIYAFNIIMFLILVFPLVLLVGLFPQEIDGIGLFLGFLAVLAAFILTTLLKRALIDPVVTIIMVRSYQMNIRDQQPSIDLHNQLLGISPRFKRLVTKAKEETINSSPTIGQA